MSSTPNNQSREEETVNWLTHAFGVVLVLIFFPFLLKHTIDQSTPGMVWSISIFGFGMLVLYLASTIYHYVEHGTIKRKMQILDHIGIFFLIGGTYTPVVCTYTSPETATYFLGVMWSMIAIGTVLKLFYTGKYSKISTGIYLFLGWMLIFIYQPISENMPWEIFVWIMAGGLAYTSGVVFFRWNSLKYQHGIWHVFVLAGTACHFVAIYNGV